MTFTKEWLQQTISEIEAIRDEIPFGLDEHESNMLEVLKLAMASLEADPVYQFWNVKTHEWVECDKATYDSFTHSQRRVLYTATPAPVVPDAIEMDDDFDSAFEHGKAVGWNACRAAMLQGAAGNSPAIPDGWQLVPKKITIEMECALSRADSYEIGWQWALEAAPQQEVK